MAPHPREKPSTHGVRFHSAPLDRSVSRASIELQRAGQAAQQFCLSLHHKLNGVSAAFDDALQSNQAHVCLQVAIAEAMDMVANDPDKAAERLSALRIAYAHIVATDARTKKP